MGNGSGYVSLSIPTMQYMIDSTAELLSEWVPGDGYECPIDLACNQASADKEHEYFSESTELGAARLRAGVLHEEWGQASKARRAACEALDEATEREVVARLDFYRARQQIDHEEEEEPPATAGYSIGRKVTLCRRNNPDGPQNGKGGE